MTGAIPLRIRPEAELFEPVEPAALRWPLAGPGQRAGIEPAAPYSYGDAYDAMARNGRGRVRPAELHPWLSQDTQVCRLADAWHLPRFGLLVQDDGTTPQATIGGPLTAPERLAAGPGLVGSSEGWAFEPPARPPPRIDRASVFMPWGGGFNYGHMVLDGLSSLLALEEAGVLAGAPAIAPPLKPWQRELVALLLGRRGGAVVRELAAPVVRLGEAAYATSMDHFLHRPNALLLRLRRRLLEAAGPPRAGTRRLYLSRRSHAHPMRILLNEAELERALERRGFQVVRPERLSPAEQIRLAAGAEVVVGPTGAGMTNALFAPAGACVVDIQPQVFASAWTPALCEAVGHHWRVYYAPAPASEAEVPWVRRARRGFRFGYRLPLDDFLAFLDSEVLAG